MEFDKKEILIESFSLLKNNWETKYDAIRECIAQMIPIDTDIAVDMWLQVAQRSKKRKNLNEVSSEMFNWTLYAILKKIDVQDEIKFAASIFKNKEFCDYMYKYNSHLGDEESKIIKWAIFQNDTESLLYVLRSVQKNKANDNYTIGRVIFEAIKDYKRIRCGGHVLEDKTKLSLVEFIQTIKSKVEKSEANVALMSIL